MSTTNEPFKPIYQETADTVRDRLLSAMPATLSRVEGSFGRDVLEVAVLEFTRLWDEMNRYLSYTFPSYAYGQLLDAHAANYGLERSVGTTASATVRFVGVVGTVIPVKTSVSVPTTDPDLLRAYYETTNAASVVIPAAGYVELDVIATDVGTHANQPVGAVTMLETVIDGISSVSNVTPAVGGSDPETDDELRERVLLAAALPTGSGTKVDYVRWGLEVPGVDEVTVEPLWDDSAATPGAGNPNGSVRLALRGPNFTPVDWGVLQEAQKYIDPSRQMVALLEDGETWTVSGGTSSWSATATQTGRSSLRLTTTGATAVTASLPQSLDLSRFSSDDASYLWIYADDWSRVASSSYVRFSESATRYFQGTFANHVNDTFASTSKPTSGSGWWLFRLERGDAEPGAGHGGTGTPSWSAITAVSVTINTTAATSVNLDYWSVRSQVGAVGEGRAPIGAAVTVVTVVPRLINVSAAIEVASGYTLTGAPGTTDLSSLLTERLRSFLIAQPPGNPIRVIDIANAIHDTPGVVDFTLNTPVTNVPVTMHEYATLGQLVLTAI